MPETQAETPVQTSASAVELLEPFVKQLSQVVVGKEHLIRLATCCLIAEGHLLIEDIPGVGKTTLAKALGLSASLEYNRIQFTSDMLPTDILGLSIYSRQREAFDFHPGPIFSQLVLADEVNRATPKTQSALLEAMAEHQVSIEGLTRELPSPFFVIATQNPVDFSGTFPLPDSQLDRFLMRLSMGYPDREAERNLLLNPNRQQMMDKLKPVIDAASMLQLQTQARSIQASDALIDYVLALVHASRHHSALQTGMSPRASLALLRSSRAWALMQGRQFVLPEDVQAVFVAVASHRFNPISGAELSAVEIANQMLDEVPVP